MKKLDENLSNLNMNCQELKSLLNLFDAFFLEKDMDYIIKQWFRQKDKKMICAEVPNVINSKYDVVQVANVSVANAPVAKVQAVNAPVIANDPFTNSQVKKVSQSN